MRTCFKPAAVLPIVLAALLGACGGGDAGPATATAPPTLLAQVKASAPARTASDYNDLVQRVYVAYFGRPADVAGLAFYAQNYLNAGAPTGVAGLPAAYANNAGVKALIDSFATSPESQALYPGDNTAFINAVYRNLFNRDADAAGSAFWAGAINAGSITRASAAVAIMAGAQTTDLDLVNKKNTVASAFTAALDSAAKRAAYDGLDANVIVRSMLAGVGPATSAANYQGAIIAVIGELLAANAPPDPYGGYAPVAGAGGQP